MAAEGMQAVRAQLDEKTTQSFQGQQGQRDLAALVAAGVQPRKEATPAGFRQAVARARDGQGEQSPGRTVPRSLGFDPVAAGAHFAGLNRFTRLSEQAGLTEKQRGQLLQEVRQEGQISAKLGKEIENSLRRRESSGVRLSELVKSAQALPETLKGPVQVHLPGGKVAQAPAVGQSAAAPAGKKSEQKAAARPAAATKPAAGAKPGVDKSADGQKPRPEPMGSRRGIRIGEKA
jgi:hypothetical protein